jgi:type II secretory pathway component PulF
MPQLVSGMVASGVGAAQLGDVVRFLARYYDARAHRLAAVLQGAAVPALSLIFGAAVATVVLAVFLPLIGLTNALLDRGLR